VIYTRSKFYYGHTVDDFSNKITIIEPTKDNVEVMVTIPTGRYSVMEYYPVVQTAMNNALKNTYVLSVDRATRKITISGSAEFELVVTTQAASGFDVMGFTTNRSGSDSYLGDTGSGSEYICQFKLQDYVDFNDNKFFLDGKVNETASGKQEIISFGLVNEMECNIKWINNYTHDSSSPIKTNLTGVEDARLFLDYCINKGMLEFIPDLDSPNDYYKVLLQSTSANKDGLAYRLREISGLSGYYETGKLTFRKIL
jgi:hypothetical protein